MRILMTGATGLIGKELGKKLSQAGHDLVVISRSRIKAEQELPFACEIIEADITKAPLKEKISVDVVFHLLGESVAGRRWNEKIKNEILDSRITSTLNLGKSLAQGVKHFISASAIGIYGDRPGVVLTESMTASGKDFLVDVCQRWEAAVKDLNIDKTTIIRIGIVLSAKGGALSKMLWPFKCGVGGALASGQQFMSWVHIDDLVELFLYVLNNKLDGVFNGVSPQAVTNFEFSKKLALQLERPLGPRVPEAALKLLFGEMARVVLSDQKVFPESAIKAGFVFKFKNIDEAFADILIDQKKTQECLVFEQFISQKKSKVFDFFCDAKNLEEITPETLNFKILKVSSQEINKGTLIDYKLKIHGFPVNWKTLIESWDPDDQFVDTQIKGPYAFWHQTHSFYEVKGGTLMRDKVKYKVPWNFLGWLSSGYLVSKEVNKIFEYRRKAIHKRFFK